VKHFLLSVGMLLVILTGGVYAGEEIEKRSVTELYIAFFDRAPDSAGLDYWQNADLSLDRISESFFYQKETQEKYPDALTNEEFISTIYQNLFRREPGRDGLQYWVNELENGTMTRATAILLITKGAIGNDEILLENKTDVGLYFAESGLNNIDQAWEIMQVVNVDSQSVENAKHVIDNMGIQPKIVWTKQYGTDSYEWGKAVAADMEGNIYVLGTTGGYLEDEQLIGNWDIFLTKFDKNGDREWTKLYGSSQKDMGNDITLDRVGNIYITGEKDGDAFIAKIDKKGNQIWMKEFGTPFADDIGYSIILDKSGNIYVAGVTYADKKGIATPEKGDILLVKYRNDGERLWRKQYGSTENDIAYSVRINSQDNVFVSGVTTGDLEGNIQEGAGDIFLSEFNSAGDQKWTKQIGSYGSDVACSMDIDENDNIYIAGGTSGDLIENAYVSDMWDIFLIRFNTEGNTVWKRQLGTSQFDSACSVKTGKNGIYLTGVTGGDLTGDDRYYGESIFLVRFDREGVRTAIEQYGSKKADIGYAITLDKTGRVYITGMTEGNLQEENSGYGDIFLSKFKEENE